jgi:O-antigen/teichoic acid export membrane protein
MQKKHEYAIFGKQVVYVIVGNVIVLLLGLVRLPVLTKGLGIELYGVWSLVNVTVSLIVPFALVGLNVGIVRFLAAEKDTVKISRDFFSACIVVLITGILLSILLFFLSNPLAFYVLKDGTMSVYIKLASILVLFNSIRLLSIAFFRMSRQIGLYTLLNLSYSLLQVGLIALSIFLGYKLEGAINALIVF